jgi:hypothetical protein
MDLSTDSYASGINKDKEVYLAAMKKAEEKLLAAFDRELDILPKAKMKPEERLKLIDVVKAEKVAFQNRGRIPWSAPMRVAMHDYLKTMIASRRRLAQSFDKATIFYMKSENAKSKAYSAWKSEALRPIVLSVWNYTWAPGKTARWEFFSDGTIGGGLVTWALEKDLVIAKRADAGVKGGYWIDTCKLSRDGKTMSGANQLGHRKSGQLLEDQ